MNLSLEPNNRIIHIFVAVGILVLTALAAWLSNTAIRRYEQRRSITEPNLRTRIHMIQKLLRVAIVLTGLGFALYALEIDALRRFAIGLFASAGLVGIALGFAAQTTAANLISGIMIAFVQPLRLGDRVEVEGDMGTVEDVGLFYTTLRTWDNRRVVIPNQVLSKNVIRNYSVKDPATPARVEIKVAYGTDLGRVRSMLLEEARANPLTQASPEPSVEVAALGYRTLSLALVAWAADHARSLKLAGALRERVAERFAAAGIVGRVGAPDKGPSRPDGPSRHK